MQADCFRVPFLLPCDSADAPLWLWCSILCPGHRPPHCRFQRTVNVSHFTILFLCGHEIGKTEFSPPGYIFKKYFMLITTLPPMKTCNLSIIICYSRAKAESECDCITERIWKERTCWLNRSRSSTFNLSGRWVSSGTLVGFYHIDVIGPFKLNCSLCGLQTEIHSSIFNWGFGARSHVAIVQSVSLCVLNKRLFKCGMFI